MNDKTKFAKNVILSEEGIEIDGKIFPYHVADNVAIEYIAPATNDIPAIYGLKVTIFCESVEGDPEQIRKDRTSRIQKALSEWFKKES